MKSISYFFLILVFLFDNAFTQTDEEIIKDILIEANNDDGERFNCLTEGINYDDLVKNGWARASTNSKRRDFLNNGWETPSKKIEIKCEAITEAYPDVSPFPEYVPEVEGQEDPLRSKYPIQVLSSASHYFIGDSFQSVPRLQAMMSRPTVELSPEGASNRNIKENFCLAPFFKRADLIAIPKSSLLEDIFFFVH